MLISRCGHYIRFRESKGVVESYILEIRAIKKYFHITILNLNESIK